MTVYEQPGTPGSVITFQEQYENFIGGQWVPPVEGQYFDVTTPVTGQTYTRAPRGTAADVELALDAAWDAFPVWSALSATQRAEILWKIGDRIDENLEKIAVAETWDNGKPVRETLAADIPLAADHFRYFAAAIRAQESNTNVVNDDLVAYHFLEPLGVVGQIIPWNFPILMAAWKIAPALAAGNTIVIKPASETPVSLLEFVKSFADLLPDGVLNIVNGAGSKVGNALANSPRIRKIAFTGSTSVGRSIAQSAANLIIPATLELGGKSPNVFFEDVADKDDAFYQKALEGFSLFQLNQGEICTCPSRALVQESIYDRFLADAVARVESSIQGNPLDTATQVGAQVSENQMNTILGYITVGRDEGAEVLTGGERNVLEGNLAGGFYVKPTVFKGNNSMRIFQEEVFGPVLAVTSFTDFDDAISIANDTIYGLGAGVWSRSGRIQYKAGRAIQAGRVWTNTYHNYPAGAAFGGYKESGIGRETHKMVLDSYQQTKNLLVSYSEEPQGLY